MFSIWFVVSSISFFMLGISLGIKLTIRYIYRYSNVKWLTNE